MKWIVGKAVPLLDLLREKFPDKSNTNLRQLLKHKAVLVDGKPEAHADYVPAAGATMELRSSQPATMPENRPFKILFEDDDIIAVIKPANLLSISTDQEKSRTLYAMVMAYVREKSNNAGRIFIVHRLDREVSGVMLLAKTPAAKEKLQADWASTEKLYYALVEGRPPAAHGTITSQLEENDAMRVYSTSDPTVGRRAVTHYRLLAQAKDYSLLEIRIDTGRKHQIRVHLADLGCPVAGDHRYGARSASFGQLGLHAWSLSFNHPVTGERLTLTAPPPDFMQRLLPS